MAPLDAIGLTLLKFTELKSQAQSKSDLKSVKVDRYIASLNVVKGACFRFQAMSGMYLCKTDMSQHDKECQYISIQKLRQKMLDDSTTAASSDTCVYHYSCRLRTQVLPKEPASCGQTSDL